MEPLSQSKFLQYGSAAWPKAADDAAAFVDENVQGEVQKITEHLESTDKLIGHLEQSVAIMLGVATLVIAILFGSIVFGEYRISQAVKDLISRAEEVKRRFPRLADMEEQAREALAELEVMFDAEEWLDDRYANLEIKRRQHILSVEHLIALDFVGPATAPQLRGMANFYESKYTAEHLQSDIDRALYYALMAADRGKFRFQFWNDLGLIYMDLSSRDASFLEKAVEALIRSKSQNQNQQRCYYNLGIIYFQKAIERSKAGDHAAERSLFESSRDEFEMALKHTNCWELAESKELNSLVHYNLACCLCRLAVPAQGQTPELDEAVKHLREASKYDQTKAPTWNHDIDDSDGDLAALKANSFYRQAVTELRANFELAWSKTRRS